MPQFNSISAVSLLFTFRIYSAVYAQAKHLFFNAQTMKTD